MNSKAVKELFALVLLVVCPGLLVAQFDEQLKRDIQNTGYVHSPLPLDYSKSLETAGLRKKVLASETLCDMETLDKWSHKGFGNMQLTNERSKSGKNSLRLVGQTTNPTFLNWGIGLGTSMATYEVGGANWEKYNRIHLYIYPHCEGARSIYLNLIVENDGKIKVPDKYEREGIHEINLINGQWNEIYVEMPELPRDKVSKLSFAIEIFGKERTMGDSLKFDIDDVSLQTIENPEVVTGWMPANNRIVHSTTGYGVESEKTAVVNVKNHKGKFQLVSAAGKAVVYEGKINTQKTAIGNFESIDFSSYKKEGEYFIRIGDVVSSPFHINKDIWSNSAWRMLNFIFCERCGYPIPGKHGACHHDLNANFEGKIFPFNGGWHDAADMSQQVLQSGEIIFGLLEMANNAKAKGNKQLFLRLQEEAGWGIDCILKARLGNGYRAQTWGTNLWTDGFIGTKDDSSRRRQVHVHNRAFENFVFAGVEAYAAMSIDNDPMLKEFLRKVAIEDFAFAKKRFDSLGFNDLSSIGGGGDHAAMASNSQYSANISFAASQLYKLTRDKYYADVAAKAIEYTLQCQRTEPLNDKNKTRGFFYRDLNKQSIVHYTHQSRDQAYMQALTALCETQPNNADYKKWEGAVRLYGDYLKNIMQYVQPYGLVPSGVYNVNEVKDSVNFYKVQVGIYKGASADYKEQLENGFKLDDEHYLRVFPVWFSFRGNAAVQLSTGKAAALAGRLLKDKKLMDIAEQQLFWIVGKNPFGQSIIWGEGSNYPQLYTALPGETVGGIPVGMQSRFNGDVPYWPQWNTATYKELWIGPAARWFSLISEF
ncbi:glycosyl hydrolase family 9 [Pseudoflavitalea sp. G-6-1-2]|uniref:glycoside hydrolase family 9 protein n=1 Tax=Pseudoflavitalea sp. G-6-1-2 TaxID=2728841 RepID=UPI001469A21D|nr:glycoside hydrolase family 9 protein [Pseudoflavitalea sp. G-6-1-2]NML19525.1 glycosyl hydrolase family 9 [Pseudoflavitalea sp. G-6-1-2]